jgi:hypothetical protein
VTPSLRRGHQQVVHRLGNSGFGGVAGLVAATNGEAQLAHLLEAAEWPTATIHVLPTGVGAHSGNERLLLDADNGNCVEIAFAEQVAVCDSKNSTGPVLTFPVEPFNAFLEGSRLGQ